MTGIDPIMAAAFALQTRPGAYAVLIGSGVSTGAGVPTGWQIVEDLIRRVANIDGVTNVDDPSAWYQQRFGEPATYGGIVARLGLTPADRQALIGSYIECDAEGGRRQPTAAHHALARLVAGGWVKVILTMNFDPLIEDALHAAGVRATVLASADAIAGRMPLVHAGPTLVKLHGDHRDPRIKNTDVELDAYDPDTDGLLDDVFADYGLIVCGWSADHDTALRRAIERCPVRRFTTFWAVRGAPAPDAQAIIDRRDAAVVEISDADYFLGRLADAVDALAVTSRPHPLSVAATVATAKRALAGEHTAISLHDTIRIELEKVRSLPPYTAPRYDGPGHEYLAAVDTMLADLETIVALVATTAYWGNGRTDAWWLDDITRLSRRPLVNGTVAWIELARVPGLALLWSSGVAALAAGRHDLVARLLHRQRSDPNDPADTAPPTPKVIHSGDGIKRLYRLLRRACVDHLGIGLDPFVDAWERWQYLLLIHAWDAQKNDVSAVMFTPHMRVDGGRDDTRPIPEPWLQTQLVERLPTTDDLLQRLLLAGLFGGAADRVATAIQEFGEAHTKEVQQQDWSLIKPRSSGCLPSGRHYPGRFHEDPDAD